MYGYEDKIKAFIQQNFTPATAEKANVKLTTNGLLKFLWNTFPKDCISDYTLVGIMESLDYQPIMYVVEEPTEYGDNKNPKIKITKHLIHGWCLLAPFDLGTQVINVNDTAFLN